MDPTQRRRNDDRAGDATADATPTEAVTVKEAADRLGLSTEAVRMRLRRGTLAGRKAGGGWVVLLPPDATAVGTPADRDQAGDATADQGGATPLVALVADLARRNEELAAAAAHWQARAVVLGERLAALEAGSVAGGRVAADAPQAAQDQPRATQPAGAVSPPSRPWWRRLVGAL